MTPNKKKKPFFGAKIKSRKKSGTPEFEGAQPVTHRGWVQFTLARKNVKAEKVGL